MKIELPSLDSETIQSFLQHNHVIVGGIGLLFFILGVCIGAVLWGRYKKQLALARLEIHGQREDLTPVKQRLTEPTLSPAAMPRIASPPVSDAGAPAPESSTPMPAEMAAPAAVAETTPTNAPSWPELPVSSLPTFPVVENVAPAPATTRWELPALEAPPRINAPVPASPVGLQHGELSPKRRPIVLAHRHKSPASLPPAADLSAFELPAVAPDPETEVEAFGFLMGDDLQEDEPKVSISALAAIVQGHAPAPDLPKPLSPVNASSLSSSAASLPMAASPVTSPLPQAAEMIPPIEPILPVAIEFDRHLGLIYRQPPIVPDDLTQIRGVSAALSARLNELGVYTYRQIAAWDENQVREFSQRLAFKDRITREQWIQQARGLNEARNQTLDLGAHPQQHLSDGAS